MIKEQPHISTVLKDFPGARLDIVPYLFETEQDPNPIGPIGSVSDLKNCIPIRRSGPKNIVWDSKQYNGSMLFHYLTWTSNLLKTTGLFIQMPVLRNGNYFLRFRLLISYGSGSDFKKVTVQVPLLEKLRSWFWLLEVNNWKAFYIEIFFNFHQIYC
jgi:hypothetical protein